MIVPPYTFIATASAVVNVNAVPIFADVEPDTGNLTRRRPRRRSPPAPARSWRSTSPAARRTWTPLRSGAAAGLLLLEDAAQAHGAEWRERRVGAIGRPGTFSFQASKNLNAGEGGVVITDDERVYDLAWSLINVGRVREGGWYQHRLLSGNYRMTEWQAAILNSQLRRLDEQTERRSGNALYLAQRLAQIAGNPAAEARSARHPACLPPLRSPLRCRKLLAGCRAGSFCDIFRRKECPCSPGYTPLYRNDAFRVDATTHPFAGRIDYRNLRLEAAEQALRGGGLADAVTAPGSAGGHGRHRRGGAKDTGDEREIIPEAFAAA